VIFWEKQEHWTFSPLGKIAQETAHTVSSIEEVIQLLGLVKTGELPTKDTEIEALIKAVRPVMTTAAKAIVGLVLDDYAIKKA
jgi:hypothetical protein